MTQTVPDISPLMPMHQDPLLVLPLMPWRQDPLLVVSCRPVAWCVYLLWRQWSFILALVNSRATSSCWHCRLFPCLSRAACMLPSSDCSDTWDRYAWISRSAGFCRTGSGWPTGRTLQWARPQPTEPHVVRHTYNLRRHETVDPILNSCGLFY